MKSNDFEYSILNEIEDDRIIDSGIDDIEYGDTFDDYLRWFYEEYEEELFDVDVDTRGRYRCITGKVIC